MRQNEQRLRRVILSQLYDHLVDEYSVPWPRDPFVSGRMTQHEIDAALAFKSDPCLDELRNALGRLEEGTYGICICCKGRIALDALVLNPAQRVCPACEAAFMHTDMRVLRTGASL